MLGAKDVLAVTARSTSVASRRMNSGERRTSAGTFACEQSNESGSA